MNKLGVYIHIPFCIRKCNYCDFCSFPSKEKQEFEAYTGEICRRIRTFAESRAMQTVDTVYFGGGTPTLLPLECFEKIMNTLKDCFDITYDAEISVECNPASIDRNGLDALRKMGINRISIGLQSALDNELSLLGRPHDFDDFCRCFSDARAAGFNNISTDLMYGIPDQTPESFKKTLGALCSLSPEHISAYGLKIEEGTAFAKMRDRLNFPNEDAEFEMYEDCNRILDEYGYHRYEISNFAKVGRESKHNLRYWKLEDYIGFGVAAHSCIEGRRFGNSRDIKAFLRGEDITEEQSQIETEERINEFVMLSMRLAEGIDTEKYKRQSGRDFKTDFSKTDMYIKNGFMVQNGNNIAFTTKGFFVSNAILSDMLSFDFE